ncbi:hypothetical protein BX616_002737 [Lobosporangium transversale]|nr:hypothetical protein BX616_002737 [Lobosporangium transversale]
METIHTLRTSDEANISIGRLKELGVSKSTPEGSCPYPDTDDENGNRFAETDDEFGLDDAFIDATEGALLQLGEQEVEISSPRIHLRTSARELPAISDDKSGAFERSQFSTRHRLSLGWVLERQKRWLQQL